VLKPVADIDRGIDYVTLTYKSEHGQSRVANLIHKLQREEVSAGNFACDWAMSGYAGHRAGGLEWGARHDGAIVRLSGVTAAMWWRRFGKLASNCSRIDLQQTMIFDEDPSVTIGRHFKELRREWSKHKRWPEPKLFVGPRGPETVYSGQRTSDVWLRIYHRGSRKGCEHQQGHVRYEAEIKGKLAWSTLQQLLELRDADNAAAGSCLKLTRTRGCRLWLTRDCPALLMERPKPHTTAQKRLRWLAIAVRPSVEELIESGYHVEVLKALGLSFPATLDHTDD